MLLLDILIKYDSSDSIYPIDNSFRFILRRDKKSFVARNSSLNSIGDVDIVATYNTILFSFVSNSIISLLLLKFNFIVCSPLYSSGISCNMYSLVSLKAKSFSYNLFISPMEESIEVFIGSFIIEGNKYFVFIIVCSNVLVFQYSFKIFLLLEFFDEWPLNE